MGENRINPAYPIKKFNSNKEVAVVSVFHDNILYEFTESWALQLEESRIK